MPSVDWNQVADASSRSIRIINEWQTLLELKKILRNHANILQIMEFRDSAGLNMLQHAIIAKRINCVEYLLGMGADVNTPVCNRPLHLACSLGHVDTVRLLLDFKADPSVMSAICHPEGHKSARMVFNSQIQRWQVVCLGDVYSHKFSDQFYRAITCACLADSVPCLTMLLTAGANEPDGLLHVACSTGALKCVSYLIREYCIDVNSFNCKNMTPLQCAVKWGYDMIKLLIECGARVLVRSLDQGTLLHCLYKEVQCLENLGNSVDYLVDNGLSVVINSVDESGNSVLHTLMKSLHDVFHMRKFNFASVNAQYCAATRKLLNSRANPNLMNKGGHTCMHSLFSIKTNLHDDELARGGLSTDFKTIGNLLELIIIAGANPNLCSVTQATTLSHLVIFGTNALFSTSTSHPTAIDQNQVLHLCHCLDLLLKAGAKFSGRTYHGPYCLLHDVIAHLDKLDVIHRSRISEKKEVAESLVAGVTKVLEALLRCGAEPNSCECVQTDLNMCYYKVISYSSMISFEQIVYLIHLMLSYGADPNIGGKHIPMSVFRYRGHNLYWPIYPLLHLLNQLSSAKTCYSNSQILHLCRLFMSTMNAYDVRHCLATYMSHDCRFSNSENITFIIDVFPLIFEPRSLKHLSALVIFKEILKSRSYRAKNLPLPKLLQAYISDLIY